MLNGTNERSRERAEKDGEGEERGKKKKKKKRVPFRRSVRLYHLFTSFRARNHSRAYVYLHNAYTRNFQDRGYDRVIISTYIRYQMIKFHFTFCFKISKKKKINNGLFFRIGFLEFWIYMCVCACILCIEKDWEIDLWI